VDQNLTQCMRLREDSQQTSALGVSDPANDLYTWLHAINSLSL